MDDALSNTFAETDMVSLQEHIMAQQDYHPTATGEFTWLLSGIAKATRFISAKVRRAGLVDILGATGEVNVQDEQVQKLDIFANDLLIKCLGYRGNVGILASEENEEPVVLKDAGANGRYIVLFDPLDGSSNIDVNATVGTIFSILKRQEPGFGERDAMTDLLQPGVKQIAAGYVIYGSATVFCYTTGQGVHLFTLDPTTGTYILHEEDRKIPERGSIYSVNEANFPTFSPEIQAYLKAIKNDEESSYTSRYIGSFVADFHRTLLKGGVFLYPSTKKAPGGKLRLLYEANPMAFLAEQAGGMASDGKQRILDIMPQGLHERVPLIIGSKHEVQMAIDYCSGKLK